MAYTTFSRTFPATHSKKGQPTFFPEKIWASFPGGFPQQQLEDKFVFNYASGVPVAMWDIINTYKPKFHTFRIGHGRKVGDKFEPRIWTGKPYASPQFTFAPPLEIKKIWDWKARETGILEINGKVCTPETMLAAAENDGLEFPEFYEWLVLPSVKQNKTTCGQIICWNDGIEYP